MKIAIFPNHGGCGLPKFISDKLEDDGRLWRVKLSEILDKLPKTHEKITRDVYDNLKEESYIKDDEVIFVKKKDYYTVQIKILEIDTSRPWRIYEYDGAEGVEYFNGVKIIDKETNMSEW